EGGRGKHFLFLAELSGVFYEGGGVPLAENDAVAFRFEPLVEEAELGGFSGAVDAFDDEKPAGKAMLAEARDARGGRLKGQEDFKRADANTGSDFHAPLSPRHAPAV